MLRSTNYLFRHFLNETPSLAKVTCRPFKFWSRSTNANNSSNSIAKTDDKLSLAYYSLDPHYLTANKPDPIIMYHSLLTSKDMYQNSVKQLAELTGRTVYLLDMRNHGESPHADINNSDLNVVAKDVIDFMDENKLKKAALVGHGVGSLAMLRASLLYGDRVEKVAAIDVMPIDLVQFGTGLLDQMVFAVSMLPKNMSLSSARLIVKGQLNRYFRDKSLLHFILMNLTEDINGSIKWRFNLPVIRQMVIKGIDRSMIADKQYSGDVLIVSGKYGSMTANNYSKLKQWFPRSKFEFYQRLKHFLHSERQKQFVNVLTKFIGHKPKSVETEGENKQG